MTIEIERVRIRSAGIGHVVAAACAADKSHSR